MRERDRKEGGREEGRERETEGEREREGRWSRVVVGVYGHLFGVSGHLLLITRGLHLVCIFFRYSVTSVACCIPTRDAGLQ